MPEVHTSVMSSDEQSNEEFHEFTQDEMDQLLYMWDDTVNPVQEYHYMKAEWLDPRVQQNQAKQAADFQKTSHDTGHRTIVNLNKGADREPVPLDLDTDEAIHVVEFYVHYCQHCRIFKSHYVNVAQEVTRRSIAIPVLFHAVSCSLYPEVCRAYNIAGFPTVLGYRIGDEIESIGWELNEEGTTMTAESIANALGITLAHEPKKVTKHIFTDSNDERLYQQELQALADTAAQEMKLRQEYESTLSERFHNAAVSLAFVLKTSVFVEQELNFRRQNALRDFLQLVDWASPQDWSVRTGMVQDLLRRLDDIVLDESLLIETVEEHQSKRGEGKLWGDVKVSRQKTRGSFYEPEEDDLTDYASLDAGAILRRNSQWTEACTHSERGMGYTCGLWDLFHILTVGASLETHQLYGFQKGYLVGSRHVAEIIKRFIAHFLSCDVCRWNFISAYENCSHDHCHRLSPVMSPPASEGGQDRELPLWLWEVHNAVNSRLITESATREDREVTEEELIAAVFPTREMCPECWTDEDKMELHDKDAVYAFLKSWYWPANGTKTAFFHLGISPHDNVVTMSFIPAVAILAFMFVRRMVISRGAKSQRKDV